MPKTREYFKFDKTRKVAKSTKERRKRTQSVKSRKDVEIKKLKKDLRMAKLFYLNKVKDFRLDKQDLERDMRKLRRENSNLKGALNLRRNASDVRGKYTVNYGQFLDWLYEYGGASIEDGVSETGDFLRQYLEENPDADTRLEKIFNNMFFYAGFQGRFADTVRVQLASFERWEEADMFDEESTQLWSDYFTSDP